MSFWGELKRRNVIRVSVAYLAGVWVALQVADLTLASFDAPAWILQALILAAALGFPVALLLAWYYEITPSGIKAASDVEPTEAIGFTGRKIDFLIIGLLVIAVAILAVDRGTAVEEPEDVLPNSVAVLPFENLSDDPQDAFAAGMHEEVIARLGRLENLKVVSRTSVQRYAGTELSVPEIARQLHVKTVLEGSLRYADDRVRVTATLIDAASDSGLWSQVYDRGLADIFAIQTDIATSIAVALEARLTLAEQQSIGVQPTDSLEAYQLYLSSKAKLKPLTTTSEEFADAMNQIDRALELDPKFALAWAQKASLYLTSRFLSLDPRPAAEIQADAERAALRAVELDPNSGVAHAALANTAAWREDWTEAENEFREALAVGGEPGDYGFFELAVGRAQRAKQYLLTAKEVDPLNDSLAVFVAAVYDSLGDASAAMAEYERVPFTVAFINQIITQLGTGDPLDQIPPIGLEGRVLELGDTPDAALSELHKLYRESTLPVEYLEISALAARLGDAEFSLSAMEKALDWMPTQTYMLWRPVFADVRALPRFKEVMTERGLAKYWREYGWPDFCRPLSAQDFECD